MDDGTHDFHDFHGLSGFGYEATARDLEFASRDPPRRPGTSAKVVALHPRAHNGPVKAHRPPPRISVPSAPNHTLDAARTYWTLQRDHAIDVLRILDGPGDIRAKLRLVHKLTCHFKTQVAELK